MFPPPPTAPGWYADPLQLHDRRYFDGEAWTEQLSSADKIHKNRPRPPASHIVVRYTISGDGTLNRITARTTGRIRAPRRVLGLATLLTIAAFTLLAISALTDKQHRWIEFLPTILVGSCVSILPARLYFKYRAHPPMLAVTPTGIVLWSVTGRNRAVSADDIASIVSFTRTAGPRSPMLVVALRIALRDGTQFSPDTVSAPQTSADEQTILTELITQTRSLLRLDNPHLPLQPELTDP